MRCVRLRSGKPVVGAGGGPARSCAGGQEARDEQSARPPSMFEHGAPTRPDLSQPSQDFFSTLLAALGSRSYQNLRVVHGKHFVFPAS